ncbi:MAG: tetratricopeptide repeat protein [Candidatus Eisenbacteria bacterium]|nr:tetratricopeptide repeat protein [Candidatus Eisenbacteria bacterium]
MESRLGGHGGQPGLCPARGLLPGCPLLPAHLRRAGDPVAGTLPSVAARRRTDAPGARCVAHGCHRGPPGRRNGSPARAAGRARRGDAVTTLIVLILAAVVVVALLLSPFWFGRRRRGSASLLNRYQQTTEALIDGRLADARETLKEIVRTDTEDVAAYLRLARLFRQEGDLERAVALRRSLTARELKDRALRAELLGGLVVDLLLLRRFEEARAVGATLRRVDRRHVQIARAEFYAALHREDWNAALRLATSVAGVQAGDPEPFQLRTYIAERRAAAGEYREARRLLADALKANPDYAPARLLLGDLAHGSGEAERASQVWADLLRRRPESASHVIPRLEKAYFELGRFGELSRLYEELAAEGGPRAARLRLALARMASRRGEAGEALRLIEEIPSGGVPEEELFCWRLYFLLDAGRTAEVQAALGDRIEGAVQSPPDPRCSHCGSPVAPTAARCAHCGGWLPDPFVRRRSGAPCAGS